jgi:hypothetical protein
MQLFSNICCRSLSAFISDLGRKSPAARDAVFSFDASEEQAPKAAASARVHPVRAAQNASKARSDSEMSRGASAAQNDGTVDALYYGTAQKQEVTMRMVKTRLLDPAAAASAPSAAADAAASHVK